MGCMGGVTSRIEQHLRTSLSRKDNWPGSWAQLASRWRPSAINRICFALSLFLTRVLLELVGIGMNCKSRIPKGHAYIKWAGASKVAVCRTLPHCAMNSCPLSYAPCQSSKLLA